MKGIEISKTTYSRKEGNKMRKTMKLGFLALMVAALAFTLGNSAMAFHEAATIKCMSCHTMHASENGSPANVKPANGFDAAPTGGMSGPNAHLLVQSNKTDLCLACHSTNKDMGAGGVAPDVYDTGTDPATPGGDFKLAGTGSTADGHNPYYAASGTIPQDAAITDDKPPGATVALWEWSCLSCHRPHKDTSATGDKGTYAYRLLRKELKGPGTSGTYVDVSSALSVTDNQEATLIAAGKNKDAEAADNHNVYLVTTVNTEGNGFGEWCGGCHGNFHGAANEKSSGEWIRHPTYQPLGTDIAGNYTTTYDPAYPLEVNSTAGLGIGTTTLTSPDVNAQVFCLSCHKAHASPYANATRWDNTTASGSGTGCNKCHAKG